VKVAVVGAGFAGLAVCLRLLDLGIEVDLYDQKGVGAGASGVASGLLHPYIGESGKRSQRASEALEEARRLLVIAGEHGQEEVANFQGIVRQTPKELVPLFLEHAKLYGDVERVGEELFLITSGVSVYASLYVQGLYRACLVKGLRFHIQHVPLMQNLPDADVTVFTIGAGILLFPICQEWRLHAVKGQAVICSWPEELPVLSKSLVGKGHITPMKGGKKVCLGSTYERGILDARSCLEAALPDLTAKARVLMPGWTNITVEECFAGVRVSCARQYVPLIQKVGDKVFAITALGSRGLLYHGIIAKDFVDQLRG